MFDHTTFIFFQWLLLYPFNLFIIDSCFDTLILFVQFKTLNQLKLLKHLFLEKCRFKKKFPFLQIIGSRGTVEINPLYAMLVEASIHGVLVFNGTSVSLVFLSDFKAMTSGVHFWVRKRVKTIFLCFRSVFHDGSQLAKCIHIQGISLPCTLMAPYKQHFCLVIFPSNFCAYGF